ncbi:hypothetical protein [Coxiella endosymbiont of Ornithodoros maritimus]|nr:hypothetical protein [Coxiella endosymbiont of Ornithodoros maritimus]
MSLSVHTVEFYIQNIKLKFHCQNKKFLIAALEKIEIVLKFNLP